MVIKLSLNELPLSDHFMRSSLIINKVTPIEHGILLKATINNLILKYVNENDYALIFNEIYTLRNEFLPKTNWDKSIYHMAYEGLITNNWYGIAYYDNLKPISYLDYKLRKDGIIEIGIMFTNTNYRKLGLASSLIRWLQLKFPDNDIITGTYENNTAMKKVFVNTGFFQIDCKQERIDGTNSIYYKFDKFDKFSEELQNV